MNLGRLGVFFFTDALTPTQLTDLARRTEALGYGVLWYPEARSYESFALGSFLLQQTETLLIASGIANIYARDPTATRQGQRTLASLSGGRFLLGLGVSHAPTVEGERGHSYGKPVATMRAYLDRMEAVGATAPWLAEAPPTVLGALGPRMIRLAAERTAGAFTYNATPEHTRRARAVLGPAGWVCVEQKVLRLEMPGPARAVARRILAPTLSLPNYRNHWLRLGFTEGDLEGGGSDRFIDAIVAWGDASAIRGRIQAHFDAGATHVCIQPLHPGGERLPDLEALSVLA